MDNIFDNTASTNKILVTKGNLATFTKDAAIRTIVGGKSALAVPKGRFIAVDMETGKALDATNVANAKRINLGVGIGKEIRWAFGKNGVSPQSLSGLAVGSPVCPVAPVYNSWFKCADCDKTYVMGLQILDQDSISQMNDIDNGEAFTVSEKPNCGGCEPNCNETTTCDAIQAGLVTKLNLAALNTLERKFYATPIYGYDTYWCFPMTDGVLDTAVAEFTFGEVTIDSLTITTKDDLESLEYLINQAFIDNGVKGTATLIGVDQYGNSCSPYILVNTEASDFAITDYTACTTGTPTVGHEGYCGIRILVTLPTFNCDCKIQTVAYFTGRHAKVYSIDGFEDFTTEEATSMVLPENFGSQIMWMEYEQEKGGEGRNYSYDNNYVDTGNILVNEPVSRIASSVSNSQCDKDYYLFQANFDMDHIRNKGFHNAKDGLSPNVLVAISKDDTTTLASVQTVLNAIATASGVDTIDYTGSVTERFAGEN